MKNTNKIRNEKRTSVLHDMFVEKWYLALLSLALAAILFVCITVLS